MSSNARYDAFLSYNSHDRSAVEELAGRLRAEGLALYLEVWELLPGREFQPGLAEALSDSKTCTAFLGPNGLGPWQKEEIQVAIDKRVRNPDFHVIPVLLPGAERPRRGAVAHLEFLINASWVEFPKSLDDRRAFDSLVAGIRGIKPTLSPEEVKRWEGRRPYRGLEAFGPDDAPFFFGRENLTDWLVSDLRREIRAPVGVRFLAVLGPSGSGKSSVVLAGLIPRLKEGAIDGSERWPIAVVRPGDDPLKELGTAVAAQFVPAGSLPDARQALQFSDDMRSDERMLDAFARMALNAASAESRLLVVVDQFEEVFTYRPEGEKKKEAFAKGRDTFFANLLHAAAAPGGRVAVVLTMRSDFLGLCASFERLNNVLNARLIQVGPMREDELRAAIELPAFKVSCELEPGLTERLLADVKGQAGALPLLQFTLDELWQRREVRRLTLRAYTELGGVEGALEHRANETMQKLSQADQDLCRRIFLHLVQPGEGTEDTKRRVSYRELLPDDPERAEAVKRVVGILANRDARLITTQGTSTADGAVEVAHEALIRGWKQLRQWIDADRAGLRIQRQLTEAAREWEANGRESSFLYGGTRLAVAREWAKTHRDELNLEEHEFLEASVRQEQKRQLAIRHRRRAWLLLATLVVLVIGYWIDRRLAHANEVLVALAAAEIRDVPRLIDQLQADRYLVRNLLVAMVRASPTDPSGRRLRLRGALALLPDDPTQVNYLFEQLLWVKAGPDELLVIRQALHRHGHAPALTPKLQALLEETPTELTDSQLRAAGALALFEPKDPRWPALGPRVADQLVRKNPLPIGAWRDAFQTVAPALTPPLRRHFADCSQPEQRALAYTLLFEFATNTRADVSRRTEHLAELIGEADRAQLVQV